MSEQSTTPQPASQPPAWAPTPPSANSVPPFTPPPASDVPAGGPQMIEPKKRSNKQIVLRKLAGAAIGLVVLIVVGTIWANVTGDPSTAAVGDCMVGQTANDIKVVGCDDATAEWKVLGQVSDIREADFNAAGENDTTCAAFPTTAVSFWSGKKGGNGDVLCLEQLKK